MKHHDMSVASNYQSFRMLYSAAGGGGNAVSTTLSPYGRDSISTDAFMTRDSSLIFRGVPKTSR